MQAAEAGVVLFQLREGFERLGKLHQEALAAGGDQQQVAVLRQVREQRLGVGQGLGVAAVGLQFA